MIPVPGRAATDPVEAPKRTTSPVTDQDVLGDFRFKGQSVSLSFSRSEKHKVFYIIIKKIFCVRYTVYQVIYTSDFFCKFYPYKSIKTTWMNCTQNLNESLHLPDLQDWMKLTRMANTFFMTLLCLRTKLKMDAGGKNLMYSNWCIPCLNSKSLRIVFLIIWRQNSEFF